MSNRRVKYNVFSATVHPSVFRPNEGSCKDFDLSVSRENDLCLVGRSSLFWPLVTEDMPILFPCPLSLINKAQQSAAAVHVNGVNAMQC